MNIDFSSIINFLTSPQVQHNFFPLRMGFVIVSILFVLFIIFAVFSTHYLKWMFMQDAVEFFTLRHFGAKRISRRWIKIQNRLKTGSESEYKLAIVEADDMLAGAMKRMGYEGPTLAERLDKITSATLPSIEQVYEAHKLRDRIVHEPDFTISLEEAKKNLAIFGKAFEEFQILT